MNRRLLTQKDLPEFEPVPLNLAMLVAEGLRLVQEQDLVNSTKLGEEYMVRGDGRGGGVFVCLLLYCCTAGAGRRGGLGIGLRYMVRGGREGVLCVCVLCVLCEERGAGSWLELACLRPHDLSSSHRCCCCCCPVCTCIRL